MPESRVECAGDDGKARTTNDRDQKPINGGGSAEAARDCRRWAAWVAGVPGQGLSKLCERGRDVK